MPKIEIEKPVLESRDYGNGGGIAISFHVGEKYYRGLFHAIGGDDVQMIIRRLRALADKLEEAVAVN